MAGAVGRSGSGRSATADARCARRSRTAWPRWRRRARAASRTCRGRCGRPPARHDRRRSARRRRAPRRAPAGCRRACARCRDPSPCCSKRYSPPSASIVCAHALDHRHQPERADVRLGDVEDFGRRAGLDELGQHLAAVMVRVLDLAVELAVGERAGAAFAELHVGFRIRAPSGARSPRCPWCARARPCRAPG